MTTKQRINAGMHPLMNRNPPEWASGWGIDRFGIYIEFSYDTVIQRMRWIQPGKFSMGSPAGETGSYEDEIPQHNVVIEQGYWLFDTPVTQGLWVAVMDENPSEFQSADRPVDSVSWVDAMAFIKRINGRIAGLELSLPSEAMWEYACRAGTIAATYAGDLEIIGERNAPVLDKIAWYGGNSGHGYELSEGEDTSSWVNTQYRQTMAGSRAVKLKQPNNFGCYDMLGNVWEWCADHWYDDYSGANANGRPRLGESTEDNPGRVCRGGSWYNVARIVRAACRIKLSAEGRLNNIGFRCARVQS